MRKDSLPGFWRTEIVTKKSQAQRILAHLKAGKSISPLEAIGVYGILRLAPRIHELRLAGYQIRRSMKEDIEGKRYARYSLAK